MTLYAWCLQTQKRVFFSVAMNDPVCMVRADTAPGQTARTPLLSVRPAVALAGAMYIRATVDLVDTSKALFMDPTYTIDVKSTSIKIKKKLSFGSFCLYFFYPLYKTHEKARAFKVAQHNADPNVNTQTINCKNDK